MITAIVQFTLAKPLSREEAATRFRDAAPRFQALSGLVRKYFTLDEKAAISGGVYLWQSRVEAEAYFTEAWKDRMQTQFGGRPLITYLDSPVIVDNASGKIEVYPPG